MTTTTPRGWREEFHKRWNTCRWSEKDGLHPEAFLSRGAEEGEEDSYDESAIESFIQQQIEEAVKETQDQMNRAWKAEKLSTQDQHETFQKAVEKAVESERKRISDEMPEKENCPCGKFNCHGKGWDDALEEVQSIINK